MKFGHLKTFDEFTDMLANHCGCFSIIIRRSDESVWAAVDIARSMPLYYSRDLSIISDSSEFVRTEKKINAYDIDEYAAIEMYEDTYVAYENTIYPQIKSISLGTAVNISEGCISTKTYYKHFSTINNDILNVDAIKIIEEKTQKVLKRIKGVVNNRTIALSLSGGYDSRYIACSLRKCGFDDVVCYTYGKRDSFEVIQSKKVADALRYRWVFIEHTDETVRQILNTTDEYFDYCNEHDYTIYLQNYIAVKYLRDKALIPPTSVFITGLCNDMPTGQYIPNKNSLSIYEMNEEGFAQYLCKKHFARHKVSNKMNEFYISNTKKKLSELNIKINDYTTFVQALDCVETGNEHSKRFLNMNKAHEFYGYEWLLPCWNYELLDMWYSFPIELRIHQNIYEEYITKYLGLTYGVGYKKGCATNAKTIIGEKIKRILGGAFTFVSYHIGIPVRRKADINNFSVLEVELYKKIKNKKSIIYKRAGIIMLLNIYVMENRYGDKFYNKLAKLLE